jgi:hypothetical protein
VSLHCGKSPGIVPRNRTSFTVNSTIVPFWLTVCMRGGNAAVANH